MESGKSKEDYLKAIFILHMKSCNVPSVNAAEYMGVSKPSVSVTMKQLRRKGYITMDNGGGLHPGSEEQLSAVQVCERYNSTGQLLSAHNVNTEMIESI